MINPNELKRELEKAIKNREDNNLKFNSEFQKGELSGFKEVLRRINQFFDELEKCSFCQSTINTIPKSGSGVEIHWVCLKCVNENNIDVLPEYLENIQNFGHWHRPLSGDIDQK